MPDKKTTEFKRSLSGTISAGVRNAFSSKGKKYYIIEYKDDTRYHQRGDQQRIIIDEAFMGRDSKCQIRFDTENCPTVSREHAVIVREGENWKLKHLSQTNETFVNNTSITDEYYLQNGDEIQLSEGGPRLGFIISEGSYAKSIGMSERLKDFGQQALRPYKMAIILLSAVLLLAIAGGVGYLLLSAGGPNIEKLKDDVYLVRMTEFTITSPGVNYGQPFTYNFKDNGDEEPIATGFMTDGKRFITAHQVIEPWYYADIDPKSILYVVNYNLSKYQGQVNASFVAESRNGNRISFKTSDCTCNPLNLEKIPVPVNGKTSSDYIQKVMSGNDYAYIKYNAESKITPNESLSSSMKFGTKLHILGFPISLGANKNALEPQYRMVTTSNTGLLDGKIVTDNNLDYGSAGAPVFCKKHGKYYLVGMVSSSIGVNGGVIIPISTIQ